MAIATYDLGLVSSDPYAYAKKVMLTHPSVSNQLLITQIENYNPNFEQFLIASNRTLKGNLTIVGGGYPPPKQVQMSCFLTVDQKDLFDQLKRVQDYTKIPITIIDRFEPVQYIPGVMSVPTWVGTPVTNPNGNLKGYAAFLAWVDIDQNYAQEAGVSAQSGLIYQVQFQAKFSGN